MTRTIPALTIALALAACVPVQQAVAPSIPVAPVEIVPRPPVSSVTLVWRPGDWEWTGSGYAWRAGAYEPLDSHGSIWLPGHWEGANGAYAWVRGHWL